MHLQIGVHGPHLGIQGVVGISRVVFQSAALLQVGLELLSAPPVDEKPGMKKVYLSAGWMWSFMETLY